MANITSTAFMTTKRFLHNSTQNDCSGELLSLECNLVDFGHTFAYFLMAISLVPQFFRLLKHEQRYVAGISYMWIIIRIVALSTLMKAQKFEWSFLLEICALLITLVIFGQIYMYSNNLHRQNKFILAAATLLIWIMTRVLLTIFVRRRNQLLTIGYVLLGMQMLPQILLNSLLRTGKALSKFSMILLAMSDVLLFISLPNNRTSSIQLISIYYSFSFVLFVLLQNLVYYDEHIHLISRSAHTILTPGVDLFTGLDANGPRKNGEEPQIFPGDDFEQMDDVDIIYQQVTAPKPVPTTSERTGMQKYLWYAILACIFCIEVVATSILFYRIESSWIVFVPISIVFILGIFHLLRTRLPDPLSELLRKIL